MEEWRQLEDCPGYLVNKDGRVWSEKLNRVLATKIQHGTTVCQFGPKYGKRRQVSIETMVVAYKLGSVDAAIAATKQANIQKANAAAKPYNDAKWAATHEKVLAAWEELGSVKLVYERLGCSEHCVHLHLDAAGIYPKQLIDERVAQKRAAEADEKAKRKAEQAVRKAFRDLKGEQLSLFPKTCEVCGTPITCGKRCAACKEHKEHKYTYDHTVVCAECGEEFTAKQMGRKPKYCPECAKAIAKRRNKAARRINKWPSCKAGRERKACRKSGSKCESINKRKVFERDGWICYICNEPLHRVYDPHDPLSPTVDHVIALANGGSNTYDNVRACHAICNSRKCAKPVEEVILRA